MGASQLPRHRYGQRLAVTALQKAAIGIGDIAESLGYCGLPSSTVRSRV
ncbi:hypothetical protein [Paenibacillus sp. MBLB4367]